MSYFSQGLRRVSTNDIFRRSSKGDNSIWDHYSKRRQTEPVLVLEKKQRDTTSPIFGLPAELHAIVIGQVSFQDLCSLRLVSQRVNDLLAEGEVVRRWALANFCEQQLRLQPPPRPITFEYILEQQRRLKTAQTLSKLIASYIENDVLVTTIRTNADHKRFQSIAQQISAKLIPALQIVQHYLEATKDALIDLASASSGAHCDWDRNIVQIYPTEDLQRAHRLWCFIVWMLKQLLKNPSYALPVERAMKGRYTTPPKENELYHYIVLGNLGAFVQLLGLKTNRDRRKAIDEMLRRFTPSESVHWRRYWNAAGPYRELSPTIEQVTTALKTPLTADVIWVDTVRAVLEERKALGPEAVATRGVGTPAQALEFMNDMAGYDVLHSAPPEVAGV